jgi:hypothetical protein
VTAQARCHKFKTCSVIGAGRRVRRGRALFVPSYPGTGPRCRCGCPYLRGLVLLPLTLSASDSRGIRLAGPTMLDLPVESLTCKACDRQTVTRDLPPIGIDVAAVLEQLAAVGRTDRPALSLQDGSPTCTCGVQALTWSTVVTLTVHTVGSTMLGEVSSRHSAAARTGTLSCVECSRSWDVTRPDLPAQVREAISAFTAALSRGGVGVG